MHMRNRLPIGRAREPCAARHAGHCADMAARRQGMMHKVPTCVTVRGNPSKMKPTRHSGRCTASPMSPTTISSVTKAPESMAFFACGCALV